MDNTELLNTTKETIDKISINDLIHQIIEKGINLLIVIVAILIITKIAIIISKMIVFNFHYKKKTSNQRKETIYILVVNVIKYTMGFLLFFGILITLGVSLAAIIASLGVIGVVIGIGGQDVISDIINGFFVIFEGTFEVGEYIKVGQYDGYVEKLSIKTTTLRNFNNEIINIPNSKIGEVVKLSKKKYSLFYNITIDYNNDSLEVEKMINNEIILQLNDIEEIQNSEYLGIENINCMDVIYLIKVDIDSEERFIAQRKVNKIVKNVLDKNKITIPYKRIEIKSNLGE